MIATLRRILAFVDRPGRYLCGLVLIGLVSATMNILVGLSFMLFINAAVGADMQLLYRSLVFMLSALALLLVIMPLGYWLLDSAVVHGTANLRRQIFKRALHLTAPWLEKQHSGDLTSRSTTDVLTAEQAYSTNVVNVVEVLLGGIGSMTAMILVDWKLGLGIIAYGGLRVLVYGFISRPMERTSDAVQKTLGTVTERVSDIANGGHVIRLFNYQQPIRDKFQEQNDLVVRRGMNRVKYAALANCFNNFMGSLSFSGLIIIGGWLILKGWYALSTIMLFAQLQNGVNNLFGALGHFLTHLQTSLAGGRRALELLEQQPEPQRIPLPASPTCTEATVALEHITFAYPGREEPVLRDINLKVAKGETLAIVGPSGGGKSTLFKLLLGYYPLNAGAISLLGKGLDQYTLQELREQLAYVPQTSYLFSGTIAENIGFGKPGASPEEIEAAAKTAYAHEFITQLPQGYDTLVGERGSHLSGGQRQRIAIARAILRDAPLLLLDEATSSLDAESEEQVQQALGELMKGRTTLVIAHRLSTIRDADRIIVIADGQVAEEGTHQELLGAEGVYRRLHDMQFEEDLENAG